jgi:serine/threonine protein kinase
MAPEVLASKCSCNSSPIRQKPSATPGGDGLKKPSQKITRENLDHNGSECESTYDCKADIWSLGVTMYELLTSE